MSHAIREALAAFRRAPVLTGLSAAMVGLALFVVGLFALVAYNLSQALETIERRVEVIAYLRDDAANREIEMARTDLVGFPEVADVRFVSKDSALASARRELPEFSDVFSELEVNPLPASLEVTLRDGYRSQEALERVARQASVYPFVEDVAFGEEWVDKLFALRRVAAVTAAVLGAAFALVAALIIGTALKIAIFARRDEIYVMRLVGAKAGFIRRPFLVEGAMAGLLGAGIAALLTWGTFRAVYSFLFDLEWIPLEWVGVGLLVGATFGVLASGFAVRRHLQEV